MSNILGIIALNINKQVCLVDAPPYNSNMCPIEAPLMGVLYAAGATSLFLIQ